MFRILELDGTGHCAFILAQIRLALIGIRLAYLAGMSTTPTKKFLKCRHLKELVGRRLAPEPQQHHVLKTNKRYHGQNSAKRTKPRLSFQL
jgi:hypothetical protein